MSQSPPSKKNLDVQAFVGEKKSAIEDLRLGATNLNTNLNASHWAAFTTKLQKTAALPADLSRITSDNKNYESCSFDEESVTFTISSVCCSAHLLTETTNKVADYFLNSQTNLFLRLLMFSCLMLHLCLGWIDSPHGAVWPIRIFIFIFILFHWIFFSAFSI